MEKPQRLKGHGHLLKDNEMQFEVSYFLSVFQEFIQADPKMLALPGVNHVAGFISGLSENTLGELQDQALTLMLEDGSLLPCQVESDGRLIIRGTLSGPSPPPSAGQLSS